MKSRIINFQKSAVLLLFLLSCNYSFTQNQAYIYRDSLLTAVSGYKSNIKRIDSLSNAYKKTLQASEKSQQQKVAELLKPYNVQENEQIEDLKKRLKPSDADQFSVYIQEGELLNKQAKVYDDILKEDYAKNIQPLLNKVNKCIETYAKENKIDYVWIMEEIGQQLAFGNKDKNITAKIIQKLATISTIKN